MNGQAIGAQALGFAGLRELPVEHGGPRAAGVRQQEMRVQPVEERVLRASKP